MGLKDYIQNPIKNIGVHRWVSAKRERTTLDNPAIFKGKDIGFLDEVTSFLSGYDLETTLEGSARKNAEAGNPRTYGDIDLLAKPISSKKDFNAREAVAQLYKASEGITQLSNWEVECIAEPSNSEVYVGNLIAYRFKIKSPSTSTPIDLCFAERSPLNENNSQDDPEGTELLIFEDWPPISP